MHPPFLRYIQLLKGHYPPGSTILHFSGGQASNSQCCPSLVREHFSRITALRIFLIFCMNVPYYKGKKRTRPFFQENSSSLIIHENVFWPFLAILINFGWIVLADIAYSDRVNQSLSTGNVTWSWRIIQSHKNAFLNDPSSWKRGFCPFSGVSSLRSSWYCLLW